MKKVISFFRDGKAEEAMGILATVLVIVPIILNIFTRAFFSKYYISLEAIALSAYTWIGYAGFGYLYKKDAHVDVPIVRKLLPPMGQTILDWFRDIYIFVLSVVLVYWGFKLTASNMLRFVPGSSVSLGYATLSIVIGYGSGCVRSFYSICRRIAGLFRKNKEVRGGYRAITSSFPYWLFGFSFLRGSEYWAAISLIVLIRMIRLMEDGIIDRTQLRRKFDATMRLYV